METLPREWDNAGISRVYPLKGFAALISLRPRNLRTEWVEDPWRLWDGKLWHAGGGSLRDFVRKHADRLVRLAPPAFDSRALPSYSDDIRIGADGAGGFWFWHHYLGWATADGGVDQGHWLDHYDGKRWRDAWQGIGERPPVGQHLHPISSAAGGASILVHDSGARSVFLISRQGEAFKRTSLLNASSSLGMPIDKSFVQDGSGDLWFRVADRNRFLTRLQGEALNPESRRDRPLFADRSGNLWTLADDRSGVGVRLGEKWVQAPLAGLRGDVVMTQSPDGRIWLLHNDALSQLALDESAGTVTEVGRWDWGMPMNDFRSVFCDQAGGLWIAGHANRQSRLSLPQAGFGAK